MSLVAIGVGNPPQLIPLILDSGSYQPVVYNASCLCGNFSSSRHFPGSSGTSIVSDISATMSYAAGKLVGVWAEDSLWMASPGWEPELELLAVNFTLATSSKWLPSEDMNRWGGSGILGMGPLGGVPHWPGSSHWSQSGSCRHWHVCCLAAQRSPSSQAWNDAAGRLRRTTDAGNAHAHLDTKRKFRSKRQFILASARERRAGRQPLHKCVLRRYCDLCCAARHGRINN